MSALEGRRSPDGRSANHVDESTDLVDLYWRDIRHCEPISCEEEASRVRRAREGDQSAMDELISANLRFVVSIAREYTGLGEPLAALISDGNLGLVQAAEHYDETRGFKFITYAVWWIRQSIRRAATQRRRTVPRPGNRLDDLRAVRTTERELTQHLGRGPTIAELAAGADISVDRVIRAREASTADMSLNRPADDNDEASVLSLVRSNGGQADEQIENAELAETVGVCLSILDDRERSIVKWYYGFDGHRTMTMGEIGRKWGMTRERIRQLRNRALEKLRRSCGDLLIGLSQN